MIVCIVDRIYTSTIYEPVEQTIQTIQTIWTPTQSLPSRGACANPKLHSIARTDIMPKRPTRVAHDTPCRLRRIRHGPRVAHVRMSIFRSLDISKWRENVRGRGLFCSERGAGSGLSDKPAAARLSPIMGGWPICLLVKKRAATCAALPHDRRLECRRSNLNGDHGLHDDACRCRPSLPAGRHNPAAVGR